MSRIAGRNGRLYAGLASSTAVAEPVAFLAEFAIEFTTDDIEVTAFGDANKVYVAGLPDVKGTFAGFYDDATTQLYTAALDGVARRFYLYPNNTNVGQYWWGTAAFDFSVDGSVADAVKVSGNFVAASTVTKIG